MLTGAARAVVLVLLTLGHPAAAHAQSTDVVEVANGDRITGDVRRLQHGRLSFGTAAAAAPGAQRWAGNISIVWAEVTRLASTKNLDIELATGERLTGSISSPAAGGLVVQTAAGPSRPIAMREIVYIVPIEAGFRARTTGSIDFGMNVTNAATARSYTLAAAAVHRSATHIYETEASFDSWLSARDDAERLTRNQLALDVRRRLGARWSALAKFALQQDEPLELDVRLVVGGGLRRMLLHTNRTLVAVEGGLDYDGEEYDGTGSFSHSVEVFGGTSWNWFAPGHSTEATVDATVFVSLERQRMRLELDSTLRRDLLSSMYWALSILENFDSDPPGDRPRSDLGLSVSLGWVF
jgi:hypothetical protein